MKNEDSASRRKCAPSHGRPIGNTTRFGRSARHEESRGEDEPGDRQRERCAVDEAARALAVGDERNGEDGDDDERAVEAHQRNEGRHFLLLRALLAGAKIATTSPSRPGIAERPPDFFPKIPHRAPGRPPPCARMLDRREGAPVKSTFDGAAKNCRATRRLRQAPDSRPTRDNGQRLLDRCRTDAGIALERQIDDDQEREQQRDRRR